MLPYWHSIEKFEKVIIMNVLYLGHFFPPKLLGTINTDSKGKIGFSNHNFEMSILSGFAQHSNLNIKAITIPKVYSFPYNNNKLYTAREKYNYKGIPIISLGFCNLPFVKEILGIYLGVIKILRFLNKYPKGTVHIIVNTPSKRWLKALNVAKKFTRRELTQTIIVPDIPALVTSMDDASNSIKCRILSHQDRYVMRESSICNGLVVLTEAMMEWFAPKPKHIVMEGIIAADNNGNRTDTWDNYCKEIILYTGTLRHIFGVMNLVEAFSLIQDKNVELWICGSGEAAKEIKQSATLDSRIKFFGLVDSAKAIELQHKATILINPRTSEGEFTKYSFPSKTMEYLLAGKSVIINRLPGIPEEYYNFVFTPKDESVDSLAKCIEDVIRLSPEIRHKKASEGKQFVESQKNALVQTSRILELIKTYK